MRLCPLTALLSRHVCLLLNKHSLTPAYFLSTSYEELVVFSAVVGPRAVAV